MSTAVVPITDATRITHTDPPLLPVLRLERVRFQLEVLEPIRLPTYSGSTWRGLLGHSLRHSVCVMRAPTCDGCLLRQQCAYSTFFESPAAPEQATQRYSVLPHPFVLEPPPAGQRDYVPGQQITLGLTLIGPASHLLPYLILALQGAGERGLGREHARFRLIEVLQETRPGSDDWSSIYTSANSTLNAFHSQAPVVGACPGPLQLELLTPLRIKQQGRYLRSDQLNNRALLGALATRVELLGTLYASPQDPPVTFTRQALHAAIDQVEVISPELRWLEWTRYSSRQHAHMQLGGLLGRLRLSGPGLASLWPLIALGQWLHLGKNTSFGLGRYRVVPSDSLGD